MEKIFHMNYEAKNCILWVKRHCCLVFWRFLWAVFWRSKCRYWKWNSLSNSHNRFLPPRSSVCLSIIADRPLKDGEDSQSDPASDPATSLFLHWGHDLGPESRRAALQKFQYYGYNGYLSDRVSLTRPIPDYRQDESVLALLAMCWCVDNGGVVGGRIVLWLGWLTPSKRVMG